MSKEYDKLLRCYHSVREKINFEPQVALILGSGLGDYAEQVQVEAVLDYHDIEGFPVSTVLGHKRKVCIWLCPECSGGDHAGQSAFLRRL